jgi:hypothetical protein
MGKMNSLEVFLSSEAGRKFFNLFYSWGAAVVIIGAMFKIIHLPYANQILMIGLITEALVFFISGFDNSSNNSAAVGSGVIVGGTNAGENTVATGTGEGQKGKGGSGSVVIIGGGSVAQGSGDIKPGGIASTAIPSTAGAGSATASSVGANRQQPIGAGAAPEYNQSISNTAQNLEDFSNTIQSLNEASQKLLTAYNQITETNGFVDNLATLNQNVSGLNDVFNAQLQTITEQMSAIRYINDSLSRMKNLYDGAIGDSYMFREESAKMTKHIEALNNVYARLLQAMTTNNPNQPKF